MSAIRSYDEYHYSNVCHVCKRMDVILKSCSKCGVYRYCSVEHQAEHWPLHKKLCKILHQYKIRHNLDSCFAPNRKVPAGERTWMHRRLAVKLAIERSLDREMTPAENQMWMFPRACLICDDVNKNKLFDCETCPVASFCSPEHQMYKDHTQFCQKMLLQHNYYYKILNGAPVNNVIPDMNMPLEELEKSIFDVESPEYFAVRQADKLTSFFTLMNGMKEAGHLPNGLCYVECFTLHVVGAIHDYENFDRQICEYMFHCIKNLKKLEITFVGPELANYEHDDWAFCPTCVEKNVTLVYSFKPVLYTEFHASDDYKVPNFIAAFNCGFNEFNEPSKDTWKNTLRLFILVYTPLLMTSYSEDEAVADFTKLRISTKSELLWDVIEFCRKNKYRSLLPLRDWVNPLDVYYSNSYVSVIRQQIND